MLLFNDREDEPDYPNDLRALAVGYAVIQVAEEDPAVWQWLEALLNRMITDPAAREMLRLSPLKPPTPRLLPTLVK
jgi:hypothetical protein